MENEKLVTIPHGLMLGENLHIEQLNLEDGQLMVTGGISGLEYSERSVGKERRGLFWRSKKG